MKTADKTKFEKLSTVVEILANDFDEKERAALLKMDFTSLKGLSGEQLKNRISKSSAVAMINELRAI